MCIQISLIYLESIAARVDGWNDATIRWPPQTNVDPWRNHASHSDDTSVLRSARFSHSGRLTPHWFGGIVNAPPRRRESNGFSLFWGSWEFYRGDGVTSNFVVINFRVQRYPNIRERLVDFLVYISIHRTYHRPSNNVADISGQTYSCYICADTI